MSKLYKEIGTTILEHFRCKRPISSETIRAILDDSVIDVLINKGIITIEDIKTKSVEVAKTYGFNESKV